MANMLASFESRNSLGAYGELYASKLLSKLASIRCASVHHRKYAGDIKAITSNGAILRVEVKTATLSTYDNKFHFTLKKKGHTDCKFTDFVVLLCVVDFALVIPFIIPTKDIANLRAIAITRNPQAYAGKYAKYRHNWSAIS